jgi:hypothetical protein
MSSDAVKYRRLGRTRVQVDVDSVSVLVTQGTSRVLVEGEVQRLSRGELKAFAEALMIALEETKR